MPVKQWVFVGCLLSVCWGKVSLRGASYMYRLTQVLIHDEGLGHWGGLHSVES